MSSDILGTDPLRRLIVGLPLLPFDVVNSSSYRVQPAINLSDAVCDAPAGRPYLEDFNNTGTYLGR
jgi:hypothetical protein